MTLDAIAWALAGLPPEATSFVAGVKVRTVPAGLKAGKFYVVADGPKRELESAARAVFAAATREG